MNITYTNIILSNPIEDSSKVMRIKAKIDSTLLHLIIPQGIATRLNLKEIEKREMVSVDGKKEFYPYVGPLKVNFNDQQCFAGAIVAGDKVLLGRIPMDGIGQFVKLFYFKEKTNSNTLTLTLSPCKTAPGEGIKTKPYHSERP